MKNILLFLLFSTGLTSVVLSQTTITADTVNLDEVVISANKTPEKKLTVAQQIKSISSIEIRQQNFQNTADVLANTGLISVQKSQQGGGSTVIRGFEASRVLYIVDGVRMNNLIFRAGHLQNIITIDENSLERVDVLYGPASTMYGSDALGGAIYLQTLSPKWKEQTGKAFTGNAFARYGSANQEKKGHVDFNIAGGKWAALTSFTYSDFGDLRMGSNPIGDNAFFGARRFYIDRVDGADVLVPNKDTLVQKYSGYTQYDAMQKIAFRQNENVEHNLNFQYSTTTDIPRYDRLTDPDGEGLRNAQWYYGPQKRLLAGYNLQMKDVFSGQRLHIGLHYQDVEESRHQRRVGSSGLQHRIEDVSVINFNVDLVKNLAKGQLRYGLEVESDAVTSTGERENVNTGATEPLDTRYPNGDNSMFHSDLYVSYSHYFNSKSTLNAAARGGYTTLHSTHTDDEFFRLPYSAVDQQNLTYSGSLGLVHLPSNNVKLVLNVATGYRAPNIDDLAKIFETAPGTLIVPNEDLKPEKTVTIDAGFTLWKNNRLEWETVGFYTLFFDAIVTSDFTFNGADSVLYEGVLSKVVANQNQQRAFIYGLSSQLKFNAWNHLWVYGGINYTYGRIEAEPENAPLDHIPPLFGKVGARYGSPKVFADLYLLFNGKKDIKDYYPNGEDNEQYAPPGGMPAWYTLNLKGSYLINDFLTLQAGVENILDAQYRTFASGINAPGRNIYGAIRVKF